MNDSPGTIRTRMCPSRSETGKPRQRRMRFDLYHGIFAVLQNDNFPLRFRLPLNKKLFYVRRKPALPARGLPASYQLKGSRDACAAPGNCFYCFRGSVDMLRFICYNDCIPQKKDEIRLREDGSALRRQKHTVSLVLLLCFSCASLVLLLYFIFYLIREFSHEDRKTFWHAVF